MTPLHVAVNKDKPNIFVIKALIKANPKPASMHDSEGNLPLHLAVKRGEPSHAVVNALLFAHSGCLKLENHAMVL